MNRALYKPSSKITGLGKTRRGRSPSGLAWTIVSSCLLLLGVGVSIARARQFEHQMGANMVQVISSSQIPLPIVVANANGLFSKYGIMVHTEKAQNADELRASILDGSANIAETPIEVPISILDSSLADVVIIMGGEGLTGELMVQSNIKSVSDLRGKTILIDKPDSMDTLALKKILSLKKLDPGTDCDLKVIGPGPERLQAMIFNKEYAATIQEPPVSILAKHAGMVSLGPVSKLMKMSRSQGMVAFTQRQWARQHASWVKGYIAAYVEAQRWLMNPANKESAIELMAKQSRLPADVSAETYIAKLKNPNGWAKDAEFNLKGFKNDLKLWREFKPTIDKRPRRVGDFYDSSFYRQALLMFNGPE